MKFNGLFKCGLFSTTLFACGLTYGGNNFCPNCGYCLKPNAFHQRFDMPPPPPSCRCCIDKGCPCMKDCDKKLENFKGRRHFLKKDRKVVEEKKAPVDNEVAIPEKEA